MTLGEPSAATADSIDGESCFVPARSHAGIVAFAVHDAYPALRRSAVLVAVRAA
jgi:hypothetical protein